MSLNYNKKLITLAKNLRKNATPQEKRLWYDFLSKYKKRFQRQKTIGNFIVDFYCHKAKLIIELDGSQHYSNEGKNSDEQRSAFLQTLGLQILRFSNKEVNENFEGVCFIIDKTIKERIVNIEE